MTLRALADSAALAALSILSGCGAGAKSSGADPDDVLMRVGDSVITVTEINLRIPPGLSAQDSAALFRAIAKDWADRMILSDLAAENIDNLDEIDRMTAAYRARLIIESYRRKLLQTLPKDIANDTLREYYARHKESMKLERPVIKGIFLKIPSSAQRLSDIRRWVATATPDAIDNLEKYGLGDAVKYSLFADQWLDFKTIEEQIPYRFFDSDAFVSATRDFETSASGMTYLLHISDFLPSGETMPFEVAAPLIRETLETRRGDEYIRHLMADLYRKALKEGRLVMARDNNLKLY